MLVDKSKTNKRGTEPGVNKLLANYETGVYKAYDRLERKNRIATA